MQRDRTSILDRACLVLTFAVLLAATCPGRGAGARSRAAPQATAQAKPPPTDDPPGRPQPLPEVGALLDQGTQALDAYRIPEAVGVLERALERARALSDRAGEARALARLGRARRMQVNFPAARELYQQALQQYRALPDRWGEAGARLSLGELSYEAGRPLDGLPELEEALRLARGLGEKRTEGEALTDIGNIYNDTLQPQRALAAYDAALAIHRAVGNRAAEANTLTNIGIVYRKAGEDERALAFMIGALPIHRAVGNRRSEANTLNHLSSVYRRLRRLPEAEDAVRQALDLWRAIGDRRGEANALTVLGTLNLTLQTPEGCVAALSQYRAALEVNRAVGDVSFQTAALQNMGLAHMRLQEFPEALAYFRKCIDASRVAGYREFEVASLMAIGWVLHEQEDPVSAERHLTESVALREKIVDALGGTGGVRSSLLANHRAVNDTLVHFYLRRGRLPEAFKAAQRGKARSLVALMQGGRLDVRHGMSEDELREERELRDRAARLNRQLIASGAPGDPGASVRADAVKQELARAEAALESFLDALYGRRPELARQRGARHAALEEIAASLPADTALVEYVHLPLGAVVPREETVAFVVTNPRAGGPPRLAAHRLPFAPGELSDAARDLRLRCATPGAAFRARARALFDRLLAPALSGLRGIRRACLSLLRHPAYRHPHYWAPFALYGDWR